MPFKGLLFKASMLKQSDSQAINKNIEIEISKDLEEELPPNAFRKMLIPNALKLVDDKL